MATDWTQVASCEGAWLYTEGSGESVADASGNSNTGTFKGAGEPAWVGSVTGTNAPAYATNCVNCDGSDDYVSYGTGLDNIAPMTYTVWVAPDAVTAGKYFYNASSTIGGGGTAGMYIGYYGTWDVAFRIYNTSSAFYVSATSLDSMPTAGNWYHLACAWDGSTSTASGTVIIYVNAVDATSAIASVGGTRRSDAAYYKQVYSGYDGKLTENAIFSSKLDSTDINDIYANGLKQTVSTASQYMSCMKGYW